jgi:hypothetical protein
VSSVAFLTAIPVQMELVGLLTLRPFSNFRNGSVKKGEHIGGYGSNMDKLYDKSKSATPWIEVKKKNKKEWTKDSGAKKYTTNRAKKNENAHSVYQA